MNRDRYQALQEYRIETGYKNLSQKQSRSARKQKELINKIKKQKENHNQLMID